MQRICLMAVCGLGLFVSAAGESQACWLFGCLFNHGCCAPPPCCPPPCCPSSCGYAPQPCCPTGGCGYGSSPCATGNCGVSYGPAPATTVYKPAPPRTVYESAPPRTVYEPAPQRFPRIVERPIARPFFFAPFRGPLTPAAVTYPEDTREVPQTRPEDERRPTNTSMQWEAVGLLR